MGFIEVAKNTITKEKDFDAQSVFWIDCFHELLLSICRLISSIFASLSVWVLQRYEWALCHGFCWNPKGVGTGEERWLDGKSNLQGSTMSCWSQVEALVDRSRGKSWFRMGKNECVRSIRRHTWWEEDTMELSKERNTIWLSIANLQPHLKGRKDKKERKKLRFLALAFNFLFFLCVPAMATPLVSFGVRAPLQANHWFTLIDVDGYISHSLHSS